MKIKEITNLKLVTLEALNPQEFAEYLKDSSIINTGKKVARAFQQYMKQSSKQQMQTFGLSKVKIEPGTQAQGSDNESYTWKGAQWVNDKTGRIATKEVGDDLTANAGAFTASAKHFTSNKIFQQDINRIKNQDIKKDVDITLDSMEPNDENIEQWVRLVALSQYNEVLGGEVAGQATQGQGEVDTARRIASPDELAQYLIDKGPRGFRAKHQNTIAPFLNDLLGSSSQQGQIANQIAQILKRYGIIA
jgi:hypothetical protein